MKKRCVCMAILLFFIMVAGCKEKSADPTNPSTDSTKTTGFATPTETANADSTQSAIDTMGGQKALVILDTVEDFERLFTEGDRWYWRALACTFAKPEEISLEYYFYNGVGDRTEATGEELDYILDAFQKKHPNGHPNYGYNYQRMPAAKLNEGLAILGLTMEDVKIPDSWAYYDKLDNYYSWGSDAYGVVGESVTKVEKDDDGIIRVYWQADGTQFNVKHFNTSTKENFPDLITKMVMTLQEMPDGTYRVLSNLPQS